MRVGKDDRQAPCHGFGLGQQSTKDGAYRHLNPKCGRIRRNVKVAALQSLDLVRCLVTLDDQELLALANKLSGALQPFDDAASLHRPPLPGHCYVVGHRSPLPGTHPRVPGPRSGDALPLVV